MSELAGRLEIVATPIGHLADGSERMREALAAADLVLAEDTRRSGRLLQQFGLKKPFFALHDHNEADALVPLIERLQRGERMALISDAGTPTISDPGFRLVRAARAAGIIVSPVPGPCAIVAALSVSGLPTDRFCFEGFLPSKMKARVQRLEALIDEPRTVVFYESVHRIEGMLIDAINVFGGQRPAFIARELTKMHEQAMDGSLEALRGAIATGEIPLKGEFVVVIAGNVSSSEDSGAAHAMLRVLLDEGVPVKSAARIAAKLTDQPRNLLYQEALALHKSD